MEENKKMTTCECEDQKTGMPKPKLHELIFGIPKKEDESVEADNVIVIPVAEYRHLVRCEAAVELMGKLLTKFTRYDNTRNEIIAIACEVCQDDMGENTDAE